MTESVPNGIDLSDWDITSIEEVNPIEEANPIEGLVNHVPDEQVVELLADAIQTEHVETGFTLPMESHPSTHSRASTYLASAISTISSIGSGLVDRVSDAMPGIQKGAKSTVVWTADAAGRVGAVMLDRVGKAMPGIQKGAKSTVVWAADTVSSVGSALVDSAEEIIPGTRSNLDLAMDTAGRFASATQSKMVDVMSEIKSTLNRVSNAASALLDKAEDVAPKVSKPQHATKESQTPSGLMYSAGNVGRKARIVKRQGNLIMMELMDTDSVPSTNRANHVGHTVPNIAKNSPTYRAVHNEVRSRLQQINGVSALGQNMALSN
ncbi:hypothetical protein NHE_0502 [Neorickettsia helminthoeca str. Oregon]|uniref:Uncharacterized protein n=2 Tax=Neorickettsia helminthoeca TaxID=33994 RepID=X5HK54_9RICK|nr:hypothetical protein NHE_0502 [Neorickettsia helminthoeca str. Oregon]